MEWSAEHGRVLSERRQRQGLSQEQLAEQAGLATGTVKNLEHGARTPRPSTLQLLADALGCTCHDLLEKRVHPPSMPRSVGPLDAPLSQSSPVPLTTPEVEERADLVVLEGPGESQRAKRTARLGFVSAAVIALAAVSTIVWWGRQRAADLDPNVVAVAVLENRIGDPTLDSIGREFAQRVVLGLSELDLANVTATLAATHPNSSDYAGPSDVNRSLDIHTLAAASGAGYVVTGAYDQEQGQLLVSARISDSRSGEPIYALPVVEGAAEPPGETIRVASDRIVGALAAQFDDFVPNPRLEPPPTIQAYRAFRAGLDCWRDYKVGSGSRDLLAQILEHFQHAVELDSAFMAPRFEMALLHLLVLHDLTASSSCVSEIASRRDQLGRWDNARLDCHVAGLQGDKHAQLRGIRELAELDPENQYIRHWLVVIAARARRYREALDTSVDLTDAALREPLIGRNAFLWRLECYHALGDYDSELETLHLLEKLYPGDWFARGRMRIRVLVALDRIEDVHVTIDEFMTIAQFDGQRSWVLAYAVDELRAHGYNDDAARVAERAVAYISERSRHESDLATYRPAMARSLYAAQRWDEAQVLFEQLAAEHPANIDYKGRLGTLAAKQDDREMAERILEDLRGLDRPDLLGAQTMWCARIAAQLNERERAVELLRVALSQGAAPMDSQNLMYPCIDLEPLYGYEPYEELRRPKG